MKDPAPQGDEQTRNQNIQDATNPEAPKVKSEKECMCWTPTAVGLCGTI